MKYLKWLFKKIDLGLRVEVIINISILMLAAIILIGFSISKITERNAINERIRYGEAIAQIFQSSIHFILKNENEYSLNKSSVRDKIQDLIQVNFREKGFNDLIIVDNQLNVIASKKKELIGQILKLPLLENSIQSGQFNSEIDKSGSFLTTHYRKIAIYGPLWFEGKLIGGLKVEIPLGNLMMNILETKKLILITILLDALVLIFFGSFLLSRVMVTPLKELVRLTQKISEGDFDQKIEIKSKNEIGQLISSFNRMIEKLRENQEALEKHLESLESTNRKLKQAQEELLRTEKLASIGRFAAGVAHEVGNPLGAILGYTSILQRDGIDREEAKDYLKRIEKEIERINRIVRELLDFARPSKMEIKDVDINQVLKNVLSLLSYQKNFKNIESILEFKQDLPKVKGDENQISQVFINIILNAVDAMPNGGRLTIKTEDLTVGSTFLGNIQNLNPPRRRSDPKEADFSQMRRPDPWATFFTKFTKRDQLVKVRISDTGVGIKKEDIKKIFDPFFTTKSPDKGTGLGLSISLRIVESLGGEIKVESEEGRGTSFEVYFPVRA